MQGRGQKASEHNRERLFGISRIMGLFYYRYVFVEGAVAGYGLVSSELEIIFWACLLFLEISRIFINVGNILRLSISAFGAGCQVKGSGLTWFIFFGEVVSLVYWW